MFESQTKNKLGNTEIRTELVNTVREELLHFFNRNKDIATKIVEKVTDTQQLRKELPEVKKLARDRAKAITIRIPQLKDCKSCVEYVPKVDSAQILSFYMGKNTPERKDYIMENLVVPVEE